jgi:hypothetical protein
VPIGEVFLKYEKKHFSRSCFELTMAIDRDKVENVDLGKELNLKIPGKVARGPRNSFSFFLRLF